MTEFLVSSIRKRYPATIIFKKSRTEHLVKKNGEKKTYQSKKDDNNVTLDTARQEANKPTACISTTKLHQQEQQPHQQAATTKEKLN